MNSRYIKSTLILLTIGLSLLTFNRLISQELTLKTGHVIEKRVLKGYTQTVSIGNVRGTMQWQLSTDGTTWLDLSGKTQNTLSTTVTVTIYLRCAIKEPICDVVYSDVLNLIPFDLPIVTTGTISNISGTSATAGGTVVSDENSTILARGVCWAITRNPSTSNSYTTNGSGVGTFTSSITGLTTNTTYYVRAYASNLVGTSYGAEASFRTSGTLPTVTTTAISGITNISAVGGGNVTGDGSSTVTARGVCWSTAQNPTTANTKTTDGTGTGVFTSNLTGLTFTTIYYVRAYAVNSSGTAYGDQVSFTTYGNLPVVTTTPVTNVTASGATSGGNVTSTGGTAITARGVCWSLTQNPTIANPKTTDGTGSGVFVSNITGLSPNTPYYVRAYATNSTGTVYGSEHTFMTRMSVPLVTTAVITNISNISATGGGNVTSDGGTPVTERGVCWAITHNPTTAATKTVDGAGLGAFVSSLTALTPNTIYYVRAYAINSEGTSYGTEVTFKTNISVTPPLVTTAAITNITTITATGGGNVTSDGNSTVTSRGVCWSTSENPTTENNITTNGGGLGEFISNLTALTPNTTYYVRAYASNSFGKTYGEQVSFKTSPTLPAVTTTVITGITTTTATGGGNVTNDGGTPVTARGVCWSAATVPTTADTKTSDGTGSGSFTSSLTGLTGNTTYYARAYSTNSAGTSYGNEVTFKTSPVLSTVTTVAVTGITQVGATSGGNVTNDGGSVITSRGVCWSTLQNPTIANSLTSDGTGTGAFVSTLAGLTGNTTYYIRAYSTNSVGTSYGSEISFKTSPL
ncbi:MAG: hypothetical protein NTV01_05970, partial [Bacteroidia bacterium]|nr:hypothetical protein [Bacteroidia bacterium]